MHYAVVQAGGKQYKVSVGDIVTIDKLNTENESVTFDKVLLLVNDGQVKVGTPILANVKVVGKSLGNVRGEKLRISHYKSKVRHRRSIGFRADYTKVQIEKIEAPGIKTAEPSKKIVTKSAKKEKK